MKDEQLIKLRKRLPDVPDDLETQSLLEDLLNDAETYILGYTKRRELPEALYGAQVQLAAIYYNRMGMEGESSHSEGGVSRAIDTLPKDLITLLNDYRLARTVS